jgi:hypothetical protein
MEYISGIDMESPGDLVFAAPVNPVRRTAAAPNNRFVNFLVKLLRAILMLNHRNRKCSFVSPDLENNLLTLGRPVESHGCRAQMNF